MNDQLLLCALKRLGTAATAGALHDTAVGLAQSAGWPRRTWAESKVQTSSRLLQEMAKRGVVIKVDTVKENGVDRPRYGMKPGEYCKTAPMPPEPDPEGEDHPFHGATRRQTYVLFDVLDHQLLVMVRQRGEVNDLLQRHNRELGEMVGRAKAQLLAAGLRAEGVL